MEKLDIVLQMAEKGFLAEEERAKNLTDKSEKYISAIAVILSLQLLNLDNLKLTGGGSCYHWMAVIGLLALGIAFVTTFVSSKMYSYHSYPTNDQYNVILEDERVDIASAKMAFINLYTKLMNTNYPINNTRARLLSISMNLIISGFALIVFHYIVDKIAIR